MKVNDIKKVLIIGAGNMGQQISVPCAANGFDVILYDIKEEMLTIAIDRIGKLFRTQVKNKVMTQEVADAAIMRISTSTDLEAAGKDADIISESIPEDPKLKGEIFSKLNAICPEHTIFTTNTSTLLPSMIAAATGRPEKFAALHFHDVRVTTIVDVMPHPGTDEETTKVVYDFAVAIGQVPILVNKENPGYVFNFMLVQLFNSAQTLASNEIASVEDVDRSFMGVMKTAYGPFGMMDSVGIDTVYKITSYWAKALNDPQLLKNADFLKTYVDRGDLGNKTKKGFYTYPDPLYQQPDFLSGKKMDSSDT